MFRGLDFTLRSGDALILAGPNGSGKSSLLRVMAGLTPPEAGTLLWESADIRKDREAHRRRLHFIGHSDALKPVLSAEEMLRFWAGMRPGPAPDKASIEAALAQFGLDTLAGWPCRYLSAGQRRRLTLARLVASAAPLWLLDEPTTGLDSEAMARLVAVIAAHRAAGGCVALSTHAPLDLTTATTLSLTDFRPGRPDLAEEAA